MAGKTLLLPESCDAVPSDLADRGETATKERIRCVQVGVALVLNREMGAALRCYLWPQSDRGDGGMAMKRVGMSEFRERAAHYFFNGGGAGDRAGRQADRLLPPGPRAERGGDSRGPRAA